MGKSKQTELYKEKSEVHLMLPRCNEVVDTWYFQGKLGLIMENNINKACSFSYPKGISNFLQRKSKVGSVKQK